VGLAMKRGICEGGEWREGGRNCFWITLGLADWIEKEGERGMEGVGGSGEGGKHLAPTEAAH
jgi:hypothetical protein